jgi:asparagine synthase (glutamine-hydrolysing)
VLSIPPYARNHKNFRGLEKSLLRDSFVYNPQQKIYQFKDIRERQILPDNILLRKKEAFSDGVSSHGRSLFQILQEQIAVEMNIEDKTDKWLPNIATEKEYYKRLFDRFFPNCTHILPYFWMPKYTNAEDPSARTLTFYND